MRHILTQLKQVKLFRLLHLFATTEQDRFYRLQLGNVISKQSTNLHKGSSGEWQIDRMLVAQLFDYRHESVGLIMKNFLMLFMTAAKTAMNYVKCVSKRVCVYSLTTVWI